MAKVLEFVDGKGQEKANGGGFDDGAEGFVVVYAFILMETFSNEMGFVLVRNPIRSRLEFINPFASDDRMIEGSRNKQPCLIE